MVNNSIATQDQKFLDHIAPKPEETIEKFILKWEYIITIPVDYNHARCLKRFKKKYRKNFNFYHYKIKDKNFSTVSHKLIPGKTYLVKIWWVNVRTRINFDEYLLLLKANKAYLTGAQGLTILWEQKKGTLCRETTFASLDEKENLPFWDGSIQVPCMSIEYRTYWHDRGLYGFDITSSNNLPSCIIGYCDCEDLEV